MISFNVDPFVERVLRNLYRKTKGGQIWYNDSNNTYGFTTESGMTSQILAPNIPVFHEQIIRFLKEHEWDLELNTKKNFYREFYYLFDSSKNFAPSSFSLYFGCYDRRLKASYQFDTPDSCCYSSIYANRWEIDPDPKLDVESMLFENYEDFVPAFKKLWEERTVLCK